MSGNETVGCTNGRNSLDVDDSNKSLFYLKEVVHCYLDLQPSMIGRFNLKQNYFLNKPSRGRGKSVQRRLVIRNLITVIDVSHLGFMNIYVLTTKR